MQMGSSMGVESSNKGGNTEQAASTAQHSEDNSVVASQTAKPRKIARKKTETSSAPKKAKGKKRSHSEIDNVPETFVKDKEPRIESQSQPQEEKKQDSDVTASPVNTATQEADIQPAVTSIIEPACTEATPIPKPEVSTEEEEKKEEKEEKGEDCEQEKVTAPATTNDSMAVAEEEDEDEDEEDDEEEEEEEKKVEESNEVNKDTESKAQEKDDANDEEDDEEDDEEEEEEDDEEEMEVPKEAVVNVNTLAPPNQSAEEEEESEEEEEEEMKECDGEDKAEKGERNEAKENEQVESMQVESTEDQAKPAITDSQMETDVSSQEEDDAEEKEEVEKATAPSHLIDNINDLNNFAASLSNLPVYHNIKDIPDGALATFIPLNPGEEGTIYSGYWHDGKLNGYGKITTLDDVCCGYFKDNTLNGFGFFKDSGIYQEGHFVNGLLEGRCKEITVESYEGDFKGGNRSGYGTLTLPGGERYVGEFNPDANAKVTGSRLLVTGGEMKGEFRGIDQLHGKGQYKTPTGIIYHGEWKGGLFVKGTKTFTDGSVYTGAYKSVSPMKSLPHGEGELVAADGSKYVGGFKDGLKHGSGVMIPGSDARVTRVEGKWVNGELKRIVNLEGKGLESVLQTLGL